MIEINYFATGGYIQYFDLFAETLINFFPGEKKILRVVTDGDFYVDYINDEIVKIDVIKTFDLVYPCINLNKSYISYISSNFDFYITYDFKGISQQMRMFIARDLNIEDKYNWRIVNFDKNINETIKYFKN